MVGSEIQTKWPMEAFNAPANDSRSYALSGPDIEVIAGGGIDSLKDIEYYKNIGADHISLGTVCFNPLKLRKLI